MKVSTKKIIIFIIVIVVFSVSVVFTTLRAHEQRAIEQERIEQERIAEAYWNVNFIFRAAGSFPLSWAVNSVYRPFREIDPEKNGFGICAWTYLQLKFFERETGITLTYEALLDYFSQEFEPDGSLRLYNNGNHPEVQAYVEWLFELVAVESNERLNRIGRILGEYKDAHAGEDFIIPFWGWAGLSPQMLDALMRAEADPNYVLDLTSLQRAGY